MDGERKEASEVLAFWCKQSRPRQWFARDPAVAALLRERFLSLTRGRMSCAEELAFLLTPGSRF